ncbi:MAG: 2-C-methyl-D-erythritol 4-phosphate cytidylyltransferase [Ruminococcus sp.]|nr:2-C-methyl-D-erythritol 4-phosphate cytidylyltransferase [Ruminococcus sp.]
MIFAGIVAGGTGTRMGADIPKQFLKIGGKPIIMCTLEKFLDFRDIDRIYLGVHPDWVDFTKELIETYYLDDKRIVIVNGGQDRNSTVFNIINSIISEYGCNDDDIILTHDGVRPFVTTEIIAENIKTAQSYNACGTFISSVDTIIRSVDGKTVSDVPFRHEMFQAQTPQSFNISRLREVYASLTDDEKSKLTDTCSIFTVKGLPVHIVKGDVLNMKITTANDLKIADLLAHDM